jgi:flavodoxin
LQYNKESDDMTRKPLVVYFSKGGKTKKIAETVAQELQCETVDTAESLPDLSDVDLLIVGSGTYGGRPDKKLQEFLNGLKPVNKEKSAIFTTSAGPNPKSLAIMKESLENKGYEVVSTFDCRGQFLFGSRGHPNEDDFKEARTFATNLKKSQ